MQIGTVSSCIVAPIEVLLHISLKFEMKRKEEKRGQAKNI